MNSTSPRPDRARTAGEGMLISSGIMFLMYRTRRCGPLVHKILLQHRTGAISTLYRRHGFSGEIISHCVWLYYRFSLSYRDIEV
jgi:hypothetical protein